MPGGPHRTFSWGWPASQVAPIILQTGERVCVCMQVCLSSPAADCPVFSLTSVLILQSVSDGPLPLPRAQVGIFLAGGVINQLKQKGEFIGTCGREECSVTHGIQGARALGSRNRNCLSRSLFIVLPAFAFRPCSLADRPRLQSRSCDHEQPQPSSPERASTVGPHYSWIL